MVKKRSPLRLKRAEVEMVLAIRELQRRNWAFGFSAMRRLWYVFDSGLREHPGSTLPAALEKAKEVRR